MKELLMTRQFDKVEKELLNILQKDNDNIEILLKLAMVYLQFPFENEEKSIMYLNKILDFDKYNFQALLIKMYLQNYYYGKMDEDFTIFTNHNWNDSYKMAIAYYVYSWQFHWWDERMKTEEKMRWLNKSIETCPNLVFTHYNLGDMYVKLNRIALGQKCYERAIKNVKSTEFSYDDSIKAEAFIDEYVTGVRMSSINYEALKRKVIIK